MPADTELILDADSLVTFHTEKPTEEAPAQKTEDKTPTHEENLADAKSITESLFGPPMTKPAEKKTEDAPKPEDKPKTEDKPKENEKPADKKDEGTKETKPETKPPAKSASKSPAKSAIPTADEIAARVAEKLKLEQPVKPTEVKPPELNEEDQRTRTIFEAMAKSNPKDYAGIVDKFDGFLKAETAYRTAWEKDNPGKEFNPEDESHEEFYDKNEPTYKAKDFERAAIRVEADAIVEQRLGEERRQREYQEAVKTSTERLKVLEKELTAEVLQNADPELAKIEPDKIKTEDPLANAVLRQYMPALNNMCAELTKWFTPGLNYRADSNNPTHIELLRSIYNYENEILQLPAEKQVAEDGRKFMAIEDLNKLPAQEQKKYWTIWNDPNSIRALLVRDFSKQIQADLTEVRGKYQKVQSAPAEKTTPKTEEKPAEKPVAAKAAVAFPNTGGSAESAGSSNSEAVADSTFSKTIARVLFES